MIGQSSASIKQMGMELFIITIRYPILQGRIIRDIVNLASVYARSSVKNTQ